MDVNRRPLVVAIDDSADVLRLLERVLEAEGFRVRTAADGESGLALVAEEVPDLVVLDLVLPGMDGLEVCRQIRARSDAYVILLTSKGSETDRIVGLTIGADDYLVKPFATAELVARLRALLRRPRRAESGRIRRVRDLVVDLEAREVRLAGEPVPLTRIEFALLEALSENPRRVLSREQLLARVWGPAWSSEGHLVEVHVSKLRRKLGDDGRAPSYLLTVRGAGYRMCDPDPQDGSVDRLSRGR
jgi:DNA-binding response OmpR family regulator